MAKDELPEGTVTRVYHVVLIVQTTGDVGDMTPAIRDLVRDAGDYVADAISDTMPYHFDGEKEGPMLWDARMRLVEPTIDGLAPHA